MVCVTYPCRYRRVAIKSINLSLISISTDTDLQSMLRMCSNRDGTVRETNRICSTVALRLNTYTPSIISNGYLSPGRPASPRQDKTPKRGDTSWTGAGGSAPISYVTSVRASTKPLPHLRYHDKVIRFWIPKSHDTSSADNSSAR